MLFYCKMKSKKNIYSCFITLCTSCDSMPQRLICFKLNSPLRVVCVLVYVKVPSRGASRRLPGEEHQQSGDQLLLAEGTDHLDTVPDPSGRLHRRRPGRLQQSCCRIHAARRSEHTMGQIAQALRKMDGWQTYIYHKSNGHT